MPHRKQNEISLQEIEMEEISRQVQLQQKTVNAQQPLFWKHDEEEYDGSGSDSSSSRSSRSHRCLIRMNDIKIDIQAFDGKLQPDEFVDWLSTIESVFEYKEIP
ncbi:hypothetical protein MTR_7g060240 [Medicago truncatula]|uniref:Uncharacterized protein n=1 Tax=Medicago truncatula TaxID=3880 RepID=G7L3D5_MEDTR|nr:hypothetical protein MTR_7g060240 [Medicago truncatula]